MLHADDNRRQASAKQSRQRFGAVTRVPDRYQLRGQRLSRRRAAARHRLAVLERAGDTGIAGKLFGQALGSRCNFGLRGSHHAQGKVRLKSFSDDAVARRFGPDMLTVVTGTAGFGFAADTYGVHKGMVPREQPRLMLQIQYSLLPVYAYAYAPQPYEGSLALDPYINRLMLTVTSVAPSGLPA